MKIETKKKITIYQETATIEMYDEDDSNIEEYSKRLSTLLKSKDVSIFRVTDGCLIIRPSETTAILVKEEKLSEPKKKEKIKQEKEDIITDG